MRPLAVFSVGLVLVDAPVALVALVASVRYGLHDTLAFAYQWRIDHPASYAVSVILLLALALRRGRAA